jgi:hypothetical protein
MIRPQIIIQVQSFCGRNFCRWRRSRHDMAPFPLPTRLLQWSSASTSRRAAVGSGVDGAPSQSNVGDAVWVLPFYRFSVGIHRRQEERARPWNGCDTFAPILVRSYCVLFACVSMSEIFACAVDNVECVAAVAVPEGDVATPSTAVTAAWTAAITSAIAEL